jgi:Pre-toxin TG
MIFYKFFKEAFLFFVLFFCLISNSFGSGQIRVYAAGSRQESYPRAVGFVYNPAPRHDVVHMDNPLLPPPCPGCHYEFRNGVAHCIHPAPPPPPPKPLTKEQSAIKTLFFKFADDPDSCDLEEVLEAGVVVQKLIKEACDNKVEKSEGLKKVVNVVNIRIIPTFRKYKDRKTMAAIYRLDRRVSEWESGKTPVGATQKEFVSKEVIEYGILSQRLNDLVSPARKALKNIAQVTTAVGLEYLATASRTYEDFNLEDHEQVTIAREIATRFLDAADIAIGFTPAAPIQDLYGAIIGRNLITGNDLSDFERGMAIAGACTFGIGSKVPKAIKIIKAIGSSLRNRCGELAARMGIERALNSIHVMTTRETAFQEITREAVAIRSQVERGDTLYRLGTRGLSETGEAAQYWSTHNPLTTRNYGSINAIADERIRNFDFVETAVLNRDTPFITRTVRPSDGRPGGAIEVIVPAGAGVRITGHHDVRGEVLLGE